jgi:hypothetical protein
MQHTEKAIVSGKDFLASDALGTYGFPQSKRTSCLSLPRMTGTPTQKLAVPFFASQYSNW